MKKIKIFFPYCGETMGGSHVSSLTLIESLKKKNFDVLIGIHNNGIFRDYCNKKKIKYIFLNKKFYSNSKNFTNNLLNFIINFFNLCSFLKENNIDIIHLNDYRMLNTWGISAYFSNLKKIIFHQRNPVPNSRWVKINLNFISDIISISKFVYSTLSNDLKARSIIIQNPIKQIIIKKKKKKNLIGFVGNFSKRKRPEIFFKFAQKLLNQKKKFKFIFIGNIRIDDIKLIYKNFPVLKKNLTFTKYLINPYPLIQRCKMIICPAKNEGFGRVPLEAGYLNVPSVVSYSGGHKEFREFNLCLFAKGNNENDYVKIYHKALNTKIKNKLILNLLRYNKKFTTPDLHANKVIKLYTK